MSTDIGKYTFLKTIVAYALDECNMSFAEFDKAWIFAFRALVDIFFDITAEPKSVHLPREANDTVKLPSDYAGWSKIGVLTDNNEVATLRINNNITILADNSPLRDNDLIADVPSNVFTLNPYPFYLNYWFNGAYNILYNSLPEGINYPGECRVDERNNVIVLNKDFQYDGIILEYKSAPQKDPDYMIETVCQEAIIAFIKWKFKVGAEIDYYNRKIEARRRLPNKKATLQEINQAMRYSNFYKIRV